jgi:hypothetical protein
MARRDGKIGGSCLVTFTTRLRLSLRDLEPDEPFIGAITVYFKLRCSQGIDKDRSFWGACQDLHQNDCISSMFV